MASLRACSARKTNSISQNGLTMLLANVYMRAMFAAVVEVALEGTKPGSGLDVETTLRLIARMTKSAEHEIHALVLSCTRARKQMLASLPVRKPTLH